MPGLKATETLEMWQFRSLSSMLKMLLTLLQSSSLLLLSQGCQKLVKLETLSVILWLWMVIRGSEGPLDTFLTQGLSWNLQIFYVCFSYFRYSTYAAYFKLDSITGRLTVKRNLQELEADLGPGVPLLLRIIAQVAASDFWVLCWSENEHFLGSWSSQFSSVKAKSFGWSNIFCWNCYHYRWCNQ